MLIPLRGGGAVPFLLCACLLAHSASAMPQFVSFGGFQGFGNFFQPIQNAFQPFNTNVVQPFMQGVMHMLGMDDHHGGGLTTPKPKFVDDGTESPQATGKDELFPRDCGRDPDKGTGKLCFPDGLLCQDSEYKYLFF